ncbi:hypothetical protein I7I49_06795 [Sinorhizobium meliloti]|uniref:hypothetical protein n=1 Tax=Rhizobium meliloti TaxID=382 RepID=UPI00237FAAA9|nr:hypothetical protein [Sinorhizobium meliloti]MDE3809987.1 hypothetical protein [Sinorhizobium meliloti]
MAKAEKKKQCFVVGPIGDDDSDDRVHADWLLEEVIQPVFEQHFKDFDVNRADKISDPGRIDAQIITALLEADLVIADLTTLNPNAFYEIGIRHTVQKPIIHMHLEGQRIPFDIASFRSIKFQRKWPRDLRRARDTLKQAVEAATAPGHFVDNPVTFSRGKFEIAESATPADKVLFDEIESITARLERIEFGFLREYGFDTTRRKAFHVIKIKAKNSSPDKDVQTAVRPVMRKLAIDGLELHPLGRTEADIRVPVEFDVDPVFGALRHEVGEDFVVTAHGVWSAG